MYTLTNGQTLQFTVTNTDGTNPYKYSCTYGEVDTTDDSWVGLTTIAGKAGSSALKTMLTGIADRRYDIKSFVIGSLHTSDTNIIISWDSNQIFSFNLRAGYTMFYKDGVIRVVNSYGVEEVPATPTSAYTLTFDATTDWGAATGGLYTITLPATTHLLGTDIISADVFEVSAGTSTKVTPDEISINASGDVSIKVSDIPDGRFAGKLIIHV